MLLMKKYLTAQEQSALLSACGKLKEIGARRDHAWIRALLYSGFRITEFSLMTVGDAKSALLTGYIYIPKEHRKGGKRDHTKLLTHPLRLALTDLLHIRAEMGYADIVTDPLVLSRKGGAMSVRAYQERLAHWASIAGIAGKVSPHWLRHTRGVTIMEKSTSADPRSIAQVELGHANLATTAIYTQITKQHLIDQLAVIDGKSPLRKRDVRRLQARNVSGSGHATHY